MKIEYEATFENIEKDDLRKKLKEVGAEMVRDEFLQKRVTLNLPKGHEMKDTWLRVRDEGDRITMTLKTVNGDKIENQKEIELKVDDFESAVLMLKTIGCVQKSYQETKREIWSLDGVDVMIDEWPYLEPFVEIEGKSEEVVKKVSKELSFDYAKARFCCVSTLYAEKYNVSEKFVNSDIKEIVFDGKNPFLK
jgi:adenylate cyclase class 2